MAEPIRSDNPLTLTWPDGAVGIIYTSGSTSLRGIPERHVCGLSGYGALGDSCPACDRQREMVTALKRAASQPSPETGQAPAPPVQVIPPTPERVGYCLGSPSRPHRTVEWQGCYTSCVVCHQRLRYDTPESVARITGQQPPDWFPKGTPPAGEPTLDERVAAYQAVELRKAGAEIATLREKLTQAEQRIKWFEASGGVAVHTRVFQEMARREQAEQRAAQAEATTWRAAVRMVRERLHYGEGEMCGCDGCMRLSVLAGQMEARALAPASPQE